MFSNDIVLYGKHAEMIKKYSRNTSAEEHIELIINDLENKDEPVFLFSDLMECYMVAGMVGIISNKKADKDTSKDIKATIFSSVISNRKGYMQRIVKYMILSQYTNENADMLVKKAFSMKRDKDVDKQLEEELHSYVRGGLEILDDYFKNVKDYSDVANVIYQFLDDYTISDD